MRMGRRERIDIGDWIRLVSEMGEKIREYWFLEVKWINVLSRKKWLIVLNDVDRWSKMMIKNCFWI